MFLATLGLEFEFEALIAVLLLRNLESPFATSFIVNDLGWNLGACFPVHRIVSVRPLTDNGLRSWLS